MEPSVHLVEPSAELCAVVLAGGNSRRMGVNKALLRIDGVPLIERVAGEARRMTDEVWISANDPEPYRYLGLPILADRFPQAGPLAGLQAGFAASARRRVLLLACDLPGARAEWLSSLARLAPGYDAVIPITSDGRPHPLAAIYDRSCLRAIEHNLGAAIYKMTAIFDDSGLSVRWLPGPDGGFGDTDLRNLNTPEDLQAIR